MAPGCFSFARRSHCWQPSLNSALLCLWKDSTTKLGSVGGVDRVKSKLNIPDRVVGRVGDADEREKRERQRGKDKRITKVQNSGWENYKSSERKKSSRYSKIRDCKCSFRFLIRFLLQEKG